jgi:hypothetical protein
MNNNIQKYSVNQQAIETLLSWVKAGEIAIPEIQRPFVWKPVKVRDLLDSLYKGYPIGYIIAWKNPNIKLKDGSLSDGKKILIDGQQRVTALRAAILNEYVINKDYKQVKITIAFNPLEERFEVTNPAIKKNKEWISEIHPLLTGEIDQYDIIEQYLEVNPEADKKKVRAAISSLIKIPLRQIGIIELVSDLDIEVVTEIFIRINSQGVVLSQADFAMSKIAANESYDGQNLRKAIDYFCHLAIAPEYYPSIRDNDTEFVQTDYFQRMSWLKDELDDLYDPSYTDLLRVSFGTEFKRGKLSDLVSLLSGRNFETRTFEEDIAEQSFAMLKSGIMKFMGKTSFQRFVMIIKSAGFIRPWMIRSKNALNFAYLLYLSLKDQGIDSGQIESYVKRWFVMSILTGRATGSFESQFDYDIKQLATRDFGAYLSEVEAAELGDSFWEAALIQQLNSSISSSPYWHIFLAVQVATGAKGFLSKDITVANLIAHRGDIHHIFPKDYLKKNGLTRGKYNQIANYVYMQSEINIKVSNKAPHVYMSAIKEQIDTDSTNYGSITTQENLLSNLRDCCIPDNVFQMSIDDYEAFLISRRSLMAQSIKEYYNQL